MLMQQGLAPGLGEQLVQSLRHQTAPSQRAQAAPGVSTWPGPCQLRGASPRLVHSLSVTELRLRSRLRGPGGVTYNSGKRPPAYSNTSLVPEVGT